jgi:lipopolysaccharide export system permease protein
MKLGVLQRYTLAEFVRMFIPVACLFMSIFVLSEFFWRLPDFISHRAQVGQILRYMALQCPLWFVQSLPLSTMLSALLAIATLQHTGEIVAVKAMGSDPRKFFLPWLAAGLALSIAAFLLGDLAAPAGYRSARHLLHVTIRREEPSRDEHLLTYADAGRRFAVIERYHRRDGILERVYLDECDDRMQPVRSVFAPRGTRESGGWVLHDGVERVYSEGKLVSEQRFARRPLALRVDIEEFDSDISRQPLEQLTLRELTRLAEVALLRGQPAAKFTAEIHFRWALPLVNLILMLIAVPLGQRASARYGRMSSFVYTLGALIFYWTMLSLFRSMGELEIINPALSVWIPDAVFLGIGTALYLRQR